MWQHKCANVCKSGIIQMTKIRFNLKGNIC
jgi:hypothetical protein